MLYDDRFAGHTDPDDPRRLVTAAGGCTWPTFPPFRVEFASTLATGPWNCFNFETALLEMDLINTTHDHAWWQPLSVPSCVYSMTLEKIFNRGSFPEWLYQLTIRLIAWGSEEIFTHTTNGKCNKDILWGALRKPGSPYTSGSTFTQFQVEWDQLHHPDWTPPPPP